LNHGCEIDKKGTKRLTLALIRPIDPSMPQPDQTIIRENRKFAWFFLPPVDGTKEAYVDFRHLAMVGSDILHNARRVACLSDVARAAMLFQFFRYLSRIDLSKATLPTPEDEGEAG